MDTTFWNQEDGVLGAIPGEWCGVDTPDGTAYPWLRAPVGSQYVYIDKTNGNARRFWKMKADGRTDDWSSRTHVIAQRFTVAQMTDGGSTTGTFTLTEQIPAGAWVQQCIIQNLTGFAGDTTATIQIGDGTTVARYSTGTPSVFTTAVALDPGVPSGTKIHTAAKSVVVTITTTADFTAAVTNGSGVMTLYVYYLM